MQRRHLLITTLALAASTAAFAQSAKPIRLIVPYAPGGPLDVTARALAEQVKDSLGTVIVENKPGAGGNIGSDYVAKATPDGSVIGHRRRGQPRLPAPRRRHQRPAAGAWRTHPG